MLNLKIEIDSKKHLGYIYAIGFICYNLNNGIKICQIFKFSTHKTKKAFKI